METSRNVVYNNDAMVANTYSIGGVEFMYDDSTIAVMSTPKKRGRPKKDRSEDRHLPGKLVRIPDDLYGQIQQIAELNDRPTTREVKRAIQAYVEAERKRLGLEGQS
jgi:hypothetical protein